MKGNYNTLEYQHFPHSLVPS